MPEENLDERKELLITFRAEYGYLFSDLHFFQGLRFAVLGATLPIAAGLFTYYRAALPFVKHVVHMPHPIQHNDYFTAVMAAAIEIILFLAVYSVEVGVRNQTAALIARGAELEEALGVQRGAFTALKNRVRLPIIFRISGIISFGFGLGLILALILLIRAL
jgi:hypothetical protein